MTAAVIERRGRPPAFRYRTLGKRASRDSDAVLHCDQVPLEPPGRALWHAPVRLFRLHHSRIGCGRFDQAFDPAPHTVCYSVKASSNLSILRLLAREGCGFDVVSGGELERVLRVDRRAARKVVFSGVGKTSVEMRAGTPGRHSAFQCGKPIGIAGSRGVRGPPEENRAPGFAREPGCPRRHASLYFHRPAPAQVRNSDRAGARAVPASRQPQVSAGQRSERAHRIADRRRDPLFRHHGAGGRSGAGAAHRWPHDRLRRRGRRPRNSLRR